MDDIRALGEAIRSSRYLVAFTGAGISEESGIPTYRGRGGLWTKYDPDKYANIDYFRQDPSYYWDFFRDVRYPMLSRARPNDAHHALVEFERHGNLKTVITQNIDGLHQAAGSSRVIELHGTTREIICMDCGKNHSMETVFRVIEKGNPPVCSTCSGGLRPNVVFFGENLDRDVLEKAFAEAGASDFLLVVGSSLVVSPASHIPLRAKSHGAGMAIINKDPTPFDDAADFTIHDAAGKTLKRIADIILR